MLVVAALLALLPHAHASVYALADAGITLDLPAGWEMTRWSDWDFKGKTNDGGVAIDAWYTAYQLPVTKDAATGWAAVYKDRLADMRATDIVLDTSELGDVQGRPTARTTMRFAFEKNGPKGVMFVAAFPVDGKVMHVSTLAASPNAARAQKALDTLLERLTVQKAAGQIVALGGEVQTDLGFAATLPDGWRRPLPSETDATKAVVQNTGMGPADPDKCLQALHPRPNGEADVVLFCDDTWTSGILDDYSFSDEELAFKTHLFGKAAAKVAPAARLERKDRVGFLLSPEIRGKDLRIGALPYDRGTVVAWAVGEPGSAPDLESAVRAIGESLTFSGPEGGASVHDASEWVVHTLTYEPFHPAVIVSGLAFLGVLGGVAMLVLRKAPRPPNPL